MKKTILTLCFFFPVLLYAQFDFDSLLNVLDKTLDKNDYYIETKEEKLNKLKSTLKNTTNDSIKYDLNGQLFDEYNSYQSDSAMKYVREQVRLAEKLNDLYKLNSSGLNLSSVLSVNGMYKESIDMLQTIDVNSIADLKSEYYLICHTIYQNMSDNAVTQDKDRYKHQLKIYSDSIMALNDSQSYNYIVISVGNYLANKQYDVALQLLIPHFSTLQTDIRKKANVAYLISVIYKMKGERELEKQWLVISAINDLQSTNKEYISLRSLAFILYEDGDVDRAYKYIKQAFDDAIFCNARLRTVEISQLLPLINKAYQTEKELHRRQLIISLFGISFLVLFLIIAIIFVYKQMRKLDIAGIELSKANLNLKTLNEQYSVLNYELKVTNKNLSEANFIKEEYIGKYMDQCSLYLEKLDNYRRQLNKTATAGKIDDLLLTIKSKKFIENELTEFYTNFDAAFLQLFPTFVSEFTALLVDDEYVQLKQGQLLNTELRIYALVRLGIADGVKIAQFLRCSLSTIYNYRTKIKNKAKGSRDEFDEKIMQIGTSTY